MTIKYHWENMKVNVEVGVYNVAALAPMTKEVIRDVDYDYECKIKTEDVVAYLIPYNLSHAREKTKEQVNETQLANFYMSKAIDYLLENTCIDLEDLERDTYFVEFVKERYEEKALEEWEETNDAY